MWDLKSQLHHCAPKRHIETYALSCASCFAALSSCTLNDGCVQSRVKWHTRMIVLQWVGTFPWRGATSLPMKPQWPQRNPTTPTIAIHRHQPPNVCARVNQAGVNVDDSDTLPRRIRDSIHPSPACPRHGRDTHKVVSGSGGGAPFWSGAVHVNNAWACSYCCTLRHASGCDTAAKKRSCRTAKTHTRLIRLWFRLALPSAYFLYLW
jgi:hypothetical protein